MDVNIVVVIAIILGVKRPKDLESLKYKNYSYDFPCKMSYISPHQTLALCMNTASRTENSMGKVTRTV